MDAKSRANFINSVAAGQQTACPSCGAKNDAASKFCISCGKELSAPAASSAPAFAAATVETKAKYEEPNNVFAQGLPAWSIEPPQVMVRRR